MGKDEPLPVAIQVILEGAGTRHNARSALRRLHQQLNLRIMAQRLKMARPAHRRGHGLAIQDASGTKGHLEPKAIQQLTRHHLALNLSHKLHVHLLQLLVPRNAQQGILVRKLSQRLHQRGSVRTRRAHAIGEHGYQSGLGQTRLRAQSAPRQHLRQSGHRAHLPRRHLARDLKRVGIIDAHLVDLLVPCRTAVKAAQLLLGTQHAAGNLDPGQALAMRPATHSVHARGELIRPRLLLHQRDHAVQKLLDTFHAQRGSRKARKDLSLDDEPANRLGRQRAALQILIQRVFIGRRDVF